MPKYCFNAIFSAASFTSKELDAETGYSYFGARYYDPAVLAAWLSVDPMADKYPGISPYAYCAWNPLKLVDPDGRDTIRLDLTSGNISRIKADGNHSVEYYRNGQNVE